MKTPAFALVVSALCAFGVPSEAFAVVSKTMPASACQATNETNLDIGRGANDIGSIGSSLHISCPILRDNTTNTDGLSALQVKVNKYDSTTRTCTAYAVDGYGNTLKSVSRSVSGTGVKTFNWGTSLNVSSSNGATYSVICSLGGMDFAENLYWQEPDPPWWTWATDAKILPATYCKPSTGAYPLSRYSNRLTGNSPYSNGIYQVQCSPLRDGFSILAGLQDLKVRLYHGNTSDIGCEGIIADSHVNYIKSVNRSTTSAGNTTFSWGTSLNVVALNAHYGLECYFHKSDKIYSVEYAE